MRKDFKLKENDTFYYVLHRHYKTNGNAHKEFYVMRYQYHQKYANCFLKSLMFKNEKDAKIRANILNKMEGY